MLTGLLGKKIGMTQIFDQDGVIIPVTLIEAGPCTVLQKKTVKTDGYDALQLGFDMLDKAKANRPTLGRLKASGAKPPKFVREMRTKGEAEDLKAGSVIDVTLFAPGEKVDVSGISKGRGFAGPMKRHHSHRGPETHGSMYHRRPGSGGQSAYPSRVYKGKPMAGHMGAESATIQNLVVLQADKERNLLVLRGAVPGHNNCYLVIRKAVRAKAKRQTR